MLLQPYVDPDFEDDCQPDARVQRRAEEQGAEPQAQARAWLNALHLSAEDPANLETSQAFFRLLKLANSGRKADRTVKIANQSRRVIGQVWSWLVLGESGSQEGLSSQHASQQQLARTCQMLNNRCLFSLLQHALAHAPRQPLTSMQQDAIVARLLDADEMQLALLNCCVEVVSFGFSPPEALFPTATIRLGRERHTVELWAAAGWVRECLQEPGHDGLPAAPACLLGYLSAMRERIEEELAWVVNSSIFRRMLDANDRLHELEQGSHPPSNDWHFQLAGLGWAEPLLVASFLRSLAKTAMARTAAVCCWLKEQHPQLCQGQGFTAAACGLLDNALCEHLDLLFGRHLSVLVACAAYQAARTIGIDPRLRSVMHLLVDNLQEHDASVFSSALDTEGGTEAGIEDSAAAKTLRAFYNDRWLEVMEPCFGGADAGSQGKVRTGSSLEMASQPSESEDTRNGSQGSPRPGLKTAARLGASKRPLARVDANTRAPR